MDLLLYYTYIYYERLYFSNQGLLYQGQIVRRTQRRSRRVVGILNDQARPVTQIRNQGGYRSALPRRTARGTTWGRHNQQRPQPTNK
jgi:hypothetical protein